MCYDLLFSESRRFFLFFAVIFTASASIVALTVIFHMLSDLVENFDEASKDEAN